MHIFRANGFNCERVHACLIDFAQLASQKKCLAGFSGPRCIKAAIRRLASKGPEGFSL